MQDILTKELRDGLHAAQRADTRPAARMRILVGGQAFTILRYWDQGFSMDPADAPHLRGHVDLYKGAHHLGRCLVVACGQENGEMIYEFKRKTRVSDRPARDFAADDAGPVGLLPLNP